MSKIACIFGTFDPIHIGHLMIVTVTTCLNNRFEKILFIPSYNPFKNKKNISLFQHRFNMVFNSVNCYSNIDITRLKNLCL